MPRITQDRRSRLHDKCRELLNSRRHDQPINQIAREIGLSHTFLQDVCNGNTKSANAAYLERVYKYFTGKELEL